MFCRCGHSERKDTVSVGGCYSNCPGCLAGHHSEDAVTQMEAYSDGETLGETRCHQGPAILTVQHNTRGSHTCHSLDEGGTKETGLSAPTSRWWDHRCCCSQALADIRTQSLWPSNMDCKQIFSRNPLSPVPEQDHRGFQSHRLSKHPGSHCWTTQLSL